MNANQSANSIEAEAATPFQRVVALLVFFVIMGGFVFLWLGAKRIIEPAWLFGACGFKQTFGLPCPGCGITHAAEAFVTGHILEAFWIQPAGALLCVCATAAALFALLIAVFGLHFKVLRPEVFSSIVKYGLIGIVVVILVSWVFTLTRALIQRAQG